MSDEPIKVLLIEDNPDDARLIQEFLFKVNRALFQVEVSERLIDGLEALAAERFDVVLLDLSLPDSSGLATLTKVQSKARKVSTIVLTGLNDEDLAIEAVRKGAQDYLVKGQIDENLLSRAILYSLERKRAEEALRESEERYRELADSITDVFFAMDRDLKYTYWNKASEKLTGISAKEAIGKSFYELFPEAEGTAADKLYLEVLKTNKAQSIENKYPLGNQDFIFELSAYPSKDGCSVFSKDITDRKKAEEALLEERNLLRTLIDNLPDLIYVKDSESHYVINNIAHSHALGATTQNEVIGKTDFDIFPQELAANYYAGEQEVIQTGQPQISREEPFIDRATGVRRYLSTSIVPLHDIHNKVVGIVGISRDITERKRTEEQIKASLKEKEVLLQEIHHRVRNNMQVVSSLLKLQAGKMKDEKVRQAFKESQSRVSAMALVHETLYKSDSMAEIELQKNIPMLVYSVSRIFRTKGKVNLQVEIEDIKLSIDQATPLSLVINELISNSSKHAFPEGKGEIVVKARLREDDEIEVVISDDGRGIPEDIDYDKTLGLQLVKGLVESQLGGTWDIKSEGGTKHTIRFKMKEWVYPCGRLNTRPDPH